MQKTFFTWLLLYSFNHLFAAEAIMLTIDYAQKKPTKKIKVPFTSGMTALELLQRASKVRTKKVGKYIFVKSIDEIKSHPGKMGWFYFIDGQRASKVASEYVLKEVETMKWSFQVDHCLAP
ncbi:MAG: DUF4430 domain-containing protein [Thiovulaceae bacterium]|nr:DUF4430 domain-containing protein [Sulfurimonadaceae bacterium]